MQMASQQAIEMFAPQAVGPVMNSALRELVRDVSDEELTFSSQKELEEGLDALMRPVDKVMDAATFVRGIGKFQRAAMAVRAYDICKKAKVDVPKRKEFLDQYTRYPPADCSRIATTEVVWKKLAAHCIAHGTEIELRPSYMAVVAERLLRRDTATHALLPLDNREEIIEQFVQRYPQDATANSIRALIADLVPPLFGSLDANLFTPLFDSVEDRLRCRAVTPSLFLGNHAFFDLTFF
jgi:hypothetical protein